MVADIGGTGLDKSVRRMMAFLLSNDLALEYNVWGKREKRTFRDLPLFDVIYGKFDFFNCSLKLKMFWRAMQ